MDCDSASSMKMHLRQFVQGKLNQKPCIGLRGSPRRVRHKSATASYADLLTSAILSSPESRMCLGEIYDWMVKNVSGLEDQRHLHSSKGWKNAVRHTLSINPRFKKITRIGRPGWWTVERSCTAHSISDLDQFRPRSGSEPDVTLHHALFPDLLRCGASAPVSPMPYQSDYGVQQVQVRRGDGTLDVVTVSSPINCKKTVCKDASTQTDDAYCGHSRAADIEINLLENWNSQQGKMNFSDLAPSLTDSPFHSLTTIQDDQWQQYSDFSTNDNFFLSNWF